MVTAAPGLDWSIKHGRARRRLRATLGHLSDARRARWVAAARMERLIVKFRRACFIAGAREAYCATSSDEKNARWRSVARLQRALECYCDAWRFDETSAAGGGRRGMDDPVEEFEK